MITKQLFLCIGFLFLAGCASEPTGPAAEIVTPKAGQVEIYLRSGSGPNLVDTITITVDAVHVPMQGNSDWVRRTIFTSQSHTRDTLFYRYLSSGDVMTLPSRFPSATPTQIPFATQVQVITTNILSVEPGFTQYDTVIYTPGGNGSRLVNGQILTTQIVFSEERARVSTEYISRKARTEYAPSIGAVVYQDGEESKRGSLPTRDTVRMISYQR